LKEGEGFVGYDANWYGGLVPTHTASHPSKQILIFTAVRTSRLVWINSLAATSLERAHCITDYTELPVVFFDNSKLI